MNPQDFSHEGRFIGRKTVAALVTIEEESMEHCDEMETV
jgi:hypothetical protein